jgi:hypothetical protein
MWRADSCLGDSLGADRVRDDVGDEGIMTMKVHVSR